MRKPRSSSAVPDGLLASIENLQREDGAAPKARDLDLTDTLLLLAEQIADTVAARLAEDLLAMPDEEGEAESRRG